MNYTIMLLNEEIKRDLSEIEKVNGRIERLEKELADARQEVLDIQVHVTDLKQSKAILERRDITLSLELDGKKIANSVGLV